MPHAISQTSSESDCALRSGGRSRHTYCLRSFRGLDEIRSLQTFGMFSILWFIFVLCALLFVLLLYSIRSSVQDQWYLVPSQKGLNSFALCRCCGQRIFSSKTPKNNWHCTYGRTSHTKLKLLTYFHNSYLRIMMNRQI